jgi:hypothetical protein
MGKRVDLVGQVFGKLTVAAAAGVHTLPNGCFIVLWSCLCSCGRESLVRENNLRSGNSKSCGCIPRALKHGYTRLGCPSFPLYRAWQNMKSRCLDPNAISYPHYGGAGVKVCDRWLGEDGFKNFLADLGERPPGTTLGRFGDVGNYEPGNVAWMTSAEQVANRRPDRKYRTKKVVLASTPDFVPALAESVTLAQRFG